MHRFGFAVLVSVLIGYAGAAPAHAQSTADGPGCLGVNVEHCVAWLRTTMKVDESFLAGALAQRHQVDINGRPLGSGLVTVNATIPNRPGQFVILLHLRPDDTVGSVESNLLSDLLPARTEAVYDQSAFYDIVSRLLGRRCQATRVDLYRFFENSVKPRVTQQRQDFSGGLLGMHRVTSHAAGVPYCGASFAYTNLLEWHGSSNPHAARNVKNFSYIELR